MTMPKLPHNTHVIYSEGLLNIQTQMLWKNANTKKNYNLNMSPTSHVFFLPSLTMKSHNTALFFILKVLLRLKRAIQQI